MEAAEAPAVCLSYGILIESALSYLGVGVQPPTPSWGTILNEGKEFLTLAPWVSLFPGAFIMLGDGLRDALAEHTIQRPRVLVRLEPVSWTTWTGREWHPRYR